MKKEAIVPLSCPFCQKTSFLFKSGFYGNILVDSDGEQFHFHPCFVTRYEELLADASVKERIESGQNPEFVESVKERNDAIRKNKKLSLGIVMGWLGDENEQRVKVVTSDEEYIDLKFAEAPEFSAIGQLIRLDKAVRTGKGKYRLTNLEFVDAEALFLDKLSIESYYKMEFQSLDIEQLETFVQRFTQFLMDKKIIPLYIIPLPTGTSESEERFYRREVGIHTDMEIMKQFEQFTIPESIQLSVKHVQNSEISVK